ncbi:discoidin domain-containing protein [Streptomyces sp. NPDC005402]|uniref:discoidin domain-containing protein n=1 Tax=Streptomyces sp. NPDC005402 TaxID=3155338 RepID=UPI0033B98605
MDLGARATITPRVALDWEAAYCQSPTIQLSQDGTSWKGAKTVTADDGAVDTLDLSGQARYVRCSGSAGQRPGAARWWTVGQIRAHLPATVASLEEHETVAGEDPAPEPRAERLDRLPPVPHVLRPSGPTVRNQSPAMAPPAPQPDH